MTEPQPMSEQEFVEAIYSMAAQQIHAGIAPRAVEQNLVQRGLDAQSAHTVVRNLTEAMTKARKERGQRNMLYGALWCIGGAAITAVTYQAAAAASGGGRYLVAWGAILFGAIQFLGGLFQTMRGGP